MNNRLKCKFCDWSTLKGYTRKDGKFSGINKAQARLIWHCVEKHPSEYAAVQEALSQGDTP